MKSDVVFGLLNASWPVLLVGETGAIQNANRKAVESLGPSVESGSTPLESIWVAENNASPVDFLARCEQSPGTPAALRLKNSAGAVVLFQAWISSFVEDGKKLFVMQLHPEKNGTDNGYIQKQKLDCALQLARTVSLDFNNALTSILGHTSLILSKLPPDNPWRRSLMEVEKSAARAAEIASDLGAFSRQEKETKSQTAGNLNQLLQRNVETFQTIKLDKEVTWSMQFERRLYTAKFDEAKMQQALVKVMENAVEAIPSGQRGRVIVTTKNIDLTEPTQDRNARLAAGSYVCAEIADTGGGIETDVLPRIFEPFFTTKRGKHRGLGLAFIYGIVTNHGGAIAVSSQPNSGTSVRVYLPAEKQIIKENVPHAASLDGTETILMVDDEDLLLTMGQTVLSAYGYNVLTANSGKKAIEILSKGDKQIDLLITDLVMPNMSGRELVEQVRRIAPFTRILCSSGYVRSRNEESDQAGYIQKPFTSQELLMKVRQILTPAEPVNVDS
jgi:nitrogen-specific signal transduction histidine kinase